MSRLDLAADATARSFYLEQAPPEVQRSLRWLHSTAASSLRVGDKVHTLRVLTYLAEVMRLAQELRVVVEMAGLAVDEDDTENGDA